MFSGVTESGFRFEIDEEVMDDMEFLEILVDISKGDKSKLPDFVLAFFGAEQKARLYDHCRSEKGRVRLSKVEEEIKSVFGAIRDNREGTAAKNS